MELFSRGQKEYQREYRANLASALFKYRTQAILAEVREILADHSNSDYTLRKVRKYREEQTDALQSLRRLVLPLRDEGGASLATQFSDYMGPTFSLKYDAVVALIITGMNPSATRDAMTNVRRFLSFGRKTGPKDHCLRAVLSDGDAQECALAMKLIFGFVHSQPLVLGGTHHRV